MAWSSKRVNDPVPRVSAGRNLAWALLGALLLLPHGAQAAQHALSVKVILATKDGARVDPKLKDLAKELKSLEFSSYTLKDEGRFELEAGSVGRMQLPGGEWMNVKVINVVAGKDLLRVSISVEKLELKATVAIAKGATVVVPGPALKDAQVLLAIKREKAGG